MNDIARVFWYCEKWQPGGIQAVQINLLRHMPLERVHFDIAVSEDDTDLFDEQLAKAGVQKITTLSRRYASPGKRTAANFFAIAKLLRHGCYDAVHFNVCHGVELIYVFWAWLYRIPLRIVHCRNNDIGAGGRSRKLKIFCHQICKYLFGHCANVRLANSDLAAQWLFTRRDLQKKRVQVLNNGIDASRFAFDPSSRSAIRKGNGLEDAFVVGHIGHFSYQKNHEFLLDIFAELQKTVSNAKLLLIGEGDGEQSLRQKAAALGIAENVLFYGVSNDIPALLSAMDVFVLPSRFEGFGNVLIEAQASGLKCFASQDVIPRSVKITENLCWLSLERPAALWAKQIAVWADGYVREDRTSDVVRSGYDLSGMARRLTEIYTANREKAHS